MIFGKRWFRKTDKGASAETGTVDRGEARTAEAPVLPCEGIPGYPEFKLDKILQSSFQYLPQWIEKTIPKEGYASPRELVACFDWPDHLCEGRIVVTQMEPGDQDICIQAGSRQLSSDRFYSNFMVSGSKQQVLDWFCEENMEDTKDSLLNMWKEAQKDCD